MEIGALGPSSLGPSSDLVRLHTTSLQQTGGQTAVPNAPDQVDVNFRGGTPTPPPPSPLEVSKALLAGPLPAPTDASPPPPAPPPPPIPPPGGDGFLMPGPLPGAPAKQVVAPIMLTVEQDDEHLLSPKQRRDLHSQLFAQQMDQAPPTMKKLFDALREESNQQADTMEGLGHKPDRNAMFIRNVSQNLPKLAVPAYHEPPAGAAKDLMDETRSDQGKALIQNLYKHSVAFMNADRDLQLERQDNNATAVRIPSNIDVAARRAENQPSINKMLDQDMTDQEKADVHRDLGILEPNMLRAVADRGVHIFVVRQGMSEVPSRLFPQDSDPVALGQKWQDYHKQQAIYDQKLATASAAMEKDHAFQAKAARLREQQNNFVPGSPLTSAAMAAVGRNNAANELTQLTQDTLKRHGLDIDAPMQPRGHFQVASSPDGEGMFGGGFLPPGAPTFADPVAPDPPAPTHSQFGLGLLPPNLPWNAGMASLMLAQETLPMPQVRPGQTFADVARAHGATTNAQIKEFVDLAKIQNPKRADASKPFTDNEQLSVPDLFYYQGKHYSYATRYAIESANRHLPNDGKTLGCFNGGSNLMMIDERALPDDNPLTGRSRTIVHETRHAMVAVLEDDPQLGPQHRQEVAVLHQERKERESAFSYNIALQTNARFGSAEISPEQFHQVYDPQQVAHPFITAYSAEKDIEQDAEAFMAYNTALLSQQNDPKQGLDANYHILRDHDPGMFNLIAREEKLFAEGKVHPTPRTID